MSHIEQRLTALERLSIILKLSGVFVKATVSTLFSIITFRARSLRTIKSTFVVKMAQSFGVLSLREGRSMRPPTGKQIIQTFKSESVPVESVELPAVAGFPPAILHFVDCRSTSTGNVLLYLHGGGYIFPIYPGHLQMGRQFAQASHSNLVFLEYTLAPECPYPGQLVQATLALNFLLKNRKASEIIIGGDSAGGNLTLALLAHLRKPKPDIPAADLREGENIRAALCISPRCSNTSDKDSFRRNASKDIMGVASTKIFVSNWRPKQEVWAAALRGDQSFWSIIHANQILIVGGEDECYVDDIKDFARLIRASTGPNDSGERQLMTFPGEIHVQSLFDLTVGVEAASLVAINRWLQTV